MTPSKAQEALKVRANTPAHCSANNLQSWYYSQFLYALTTAFVKLSIGLFLLRIAVKRWHRVLLSVVTASIMVFSLAFTFFIILQCRPIYYYWTRIPNLAEQTDGSCVSIRVGTSLSYLHSALSAFADWTYALLPILIVRNLKMERRTKLLVAFILGMGAIGCIAVLVRTVYIYQLEMNSDFLWSATDLAIWSVLEPGIGITAGSIATLRPFFRVINNKIRRARGLPAHEEFWRRRNDTYSKMGNQPEIGTGDSNDTRGSHASNIKSGTSFSSQPPPRINERSNEDLNQKETLSGSTFGNSPDDIELSSPKNSTTTTIFGGLDSRVQRPYTSGPDDWIGGSSVRVHTAVHVCPECKPISNQSAWSQTK